MNNGKRITALLPGILLLTALVGCAPTGPAQPTIHNGSENEAGMTDDEGSKGTTGGTETTIHNGSSKDSGKTDDEGGKNTSNGNGQSTTDDGDKDPSDRGDKDTTGPARDPENNSESEEQTEMRMHIQIGDYTFTAELEDNAAVEELVEMMKEGPVSIRMDDYAGFEKVGALGKRLTSSDSQTTTVAGDIVLYNSSNIVMFYGSNSWAYTRIGHIEDLTDWEKALGSGSITAESSLWE